MVSQAPNDSDPSEPLSSQPLPPRALAALSLSSTRRVLLTLVVALIALLGLSLGGAVPGGVEWQAALGGALAALACVLIVLQVYARPGLRDLEQTVLGLKQHADRAIEASRRKSQFLANMSHEIRTPMNGVLGVTRLLLGMQLDAKQRRYVETIDASGRTLLTILNDILDFSKIEAGKYNIQAVTFDVIVVTQEVAELLAEAAHRKGVEFVCRIAPSVPARVIGDPDRYRQLLTNLVGNAVKFTGEGEVCIDVTLREQSDERATLHVEVRDTGVGISESAQGRLFEAFSQEEVGGPQKYGGTGLGLALSKRLVEMMGGSIDFSSTEGVGSRFWFELPLGLAPQLDAPRRRIQPRGGRVLIVDASQTWREVLREQLSLWTLQCETEPSGERALAMLQERAGTPSAAFHVLVVATHTRDMRGQDVISRIAGSRQLAGLPIVFLSRLGGDTLPGELADEVLAELHKPMRASDLFDAMVQAFGGEARTRKRLKSPEPSTRSHGVRVLVVEDDDVNQFVAIEQIKRLGYEVDSARNGLEAVEAVLRGGYAAVFMDCQMPVMDGYQATREIRAREQAGQHTPIIALTAHALEGERQKVLDAGMDDYLTKPLRSDALRKVLEHFVDARISTELPISVQPTAAGSLVVLDPSTSRSTRVIELVLRLLPGQVAVLGEAIDQNDFEQLHAHAHKLKGSAASIGALQMAALSESLQHAELEQADRAREQFEALREQWNAVSERLRQELAQRKVEPGSQSGAA